MLILTRAQRVLAELCDTAPQLPPSERGSIVAAVLEVQAWTQRQLQVGRERWASYIMREHLPSCINPIS